MTMVQEISKPCGVTKTMAIMNGKWTMEILYEFVQRGTVRFGELCRALPDASSKTITERLRTLEAQGMITRVLYPEIPPRVEYTLTEKGRSFKQVTDAMLAWGNQHGDHMDAF